jgi:TolB-like protein
LITAALTCALVAAAPAQVTLAAPNLTYINLDANTGGLYLDYFARKLAGEGPIRLTTRQEIAEVLGLERQKQLLGCEEANCTAELAGALGVDGILTGSFAKAGGGLVVSLKILNAKDAGSIVEAGTRVKDENALFEWLDETARIFAATLLKKANLAPAAVSAEAPARGKAWIPVAGVSAVLLGASLTTYLLAGNSEASLRSGDAPLTTSEAVAAFHAQGQTNQFLSTTFLVAGLTGLGTAALLFVVPTSSRVRPWIPGIAGVGSFVAAGVLLGLAASDEGRLRAGNGVSSLADADELRASGQAKQTSGFALLGVGAAGVIASGLMLLMSDPPPAAIGIAPVNGGAMVSASARF